MVMGSVLAQPQRVRRGRVAGPEAALIADLGSLLTRLTTDASRGGRIAGIVQDALLAAFERIVNQHLAKVQQAGPRVLQRLGDLARAITGLDASVRVNTPADALDIARRLLDHVADGMEGLSAAKIQPHVVAFIDILATDLGFSIEQAESEFRALFDDVINALEAAPPEPSVEARESRLEAACVLRQLRRHVLARFQLERMDAARLASRLARLVSNLRAPAFASRLRCVARALEQAVSTGRAVQDLVPAGAFAGFRSLGAAAAAAAQKEQYCWYASWVLHDDVVISSDGTGIRKGNTVIAHGRDLTLADIPQFLPGHDPHFSFARFGVETLETIALASAAGADALMFLLHFISLEQGNVIANSVNLPLAFTSGSLKVVLRHPLMGPIKEQWLLPLALTFPASLEGLHDKATGKNRFLMWLTLVGPDVGEERLYRFYGSALRNALLSTLTLLNHKEPAAAGVRPENFKELDGFSDFIGYIIAIMISTHMSRDDWWILNAQVTPSQIQWSLFFWHWLGKSTLCAMTGRLVGGFYAFIASQARAPFKSWLFPSWYMMLVHWFWYIAFTYWHMDGDTDDGRYNGHTGGAAFTGYPSNGSSPYTLPYSGSLCYVGQANEGVFSHNHRNGDQTYAIDFSLDQDRHVLCARPGTVVDWFDFAPDNENTSTAADPAIVKAGQTHNSGANFVLVRHDIDDNGVDIPVGTFDAVHDLGEAGVAGRTYALYLHGRNGSVREAFLSRGINAVDIIGQVVKRGDWIMRAGDTGVSFHNHLHMAISIGPDVKLPTSVKLSGLSDPDIPYVFKDVDGPVTKLNWYRSSTVET